MVCSNFNELTNKVEKICRELGLNKISPESSSVDYYCINDNNSIWDNEKQCPSAIVCIDPYFEFIYVYNEIHPVRGNKIYFGGRKYIQNNSNLYYYKKIIKNTIINYKKFMNELKLDNISKDFV